MKWNETGKVILWVWLCVCLFFSSSLGRSIFLLVIRIALLFGCLNWIEVGPPSPPPFLFFSTLPWRILSVPLNSIESNETEILLYFTYCLLFEICSAHSVVFLLRYISFHSLSKTNDRRSLKSRLVKVETSKKKSLIGFDRGTTTLPAACLVGQLNNYLLHHGQSFSLVLFDLIRRPFWFAALRSPLHLRLDALWIERVM